MKIHYLLFAVAFLAAACTKTPDPDKTEKDARLISLSVDEQQIIVPLEGTASFLFRVEEPAAEFVFDITSEQCQIELRIQGTTRQPEYFSIQSIVPSQEAGVYGLVPDHLPCGIRHFHDHFRSFSSDKLYESCRNQ